MIKSVLVLVLVLVIFNNEYINKRITNKIDHLYYYLKFNIFDDFIFQDISNKKIILNDNSNKIENKLIVHGGGLIDGHKYTESLESINKSYNLGFKLIELDIRKTSDGTFVSVYSWKKWKKMTNYKGSLPPSIKEFKKYRIYNKYTSLDINDINRWFSNHKDAILVTDKTNEPLEFSNLFIDKDRLIMELFSWNAVADGLKNDIQVMPNWTILSQLGDNKLHKLLSLNIKKMTVSRYAILDPKIKKLLENLRNYNVKVYAYHINQGNNPKNESYVICNESNYFYGLYADKWDFNRTMECK